MIEFSNFNQFMDQIEEVEDYLKRAKEVFDEQKMNQMMAKAVTYYTEAVIKNAPKKSKQMVDHIKDRKGGTSKSLMYEVYAENEGFYWKFQEYGAYNVRKREYLPGKHFVEKSVLETESEVKRFFETEIEKYINK